MYVTESGPIRADSVYSHPLRHTKGSIRKGRRPPRQYFPRLRISLEPPDSKDIPVGGLQQARGQTLPVIVLFMVSILGIAGLTIDAGSLLQAKQTTQVNADAAALAVAQGMVNGQWSTYAAHNFGVNNKTTESGSYSLTTYLAANDSVTATVVYQAPTYFSKMFGFTSVHEQSVARATVQSVHSFSGSKMPFALFNNCVPPIGQTVVVYGGSSCGSSSSNVGSIQLPASGQTAGSCDSKGVPNYTPVGNGNEFDKIMNGTVATGNVLVGGCLAQTQTGKGSGPGNDLFADYPNTSLWPPGRADPGCATGRRPRHQGPYTVTAFEWISITGCSGGTGPVSCSGVSGKEIDGLRLGIYDGTSCAGIVTGPYIPGYANSLGLTQ